MPPGTTQTITVRFNPLTAGPKSAMLTIPSDDPDENPFLVPLTATTPPTVQQIAQGGSSGSDAVTTATLLEGVAGHLYLAAVSTKPFRQVTEMTGLGLTWNRLTTQCAGRSQTGLDLWWAQGDASTGEVTATLASSTLNAVIAVAGYAGVAAADALVPLVAGNTNGVDGACTNGSDSGAYSFNITSLHANSVAFGVAALRNRTQTAGSGYTELADAAQGTGGDVASLTLMDRIVPVPTTLLLNGLLDGTTDWAVIGVELKSGP
jgi:hypothetical protein